MEDVADFYCVRLDAVGEDVAVAGDDQDAAEAAGTRGVRGGGFRQGGWRCASMAATTRDAAAGLRSVSQAWMAARSASAFRVKRTSATMAGEELPDLGLGGGVERLVVAALQLGQLGFA